jgi:guanosine-3',5'-bis(diphosphate) 3'-pyrophosphohydrolase
MLKTFARAVEYAAVKHHGQTRKGKDALPYIVHPLRVAQLVMQAAPKRGYETAVIAAVLHDTVEDTTASYADLVAEFGVEVADVVAELTDESAGPIHDRKAVQATKAPSMSIMARIVKIADQTDNVHDAAYHPAVDWSDKKRMEYIDLASKVVQACQAKENPVITRLVSTFMDEAHRAKLLLDAFSAISERK